MRWRINEILDVELGGGLFWLALLVCESWLADVFGEGPRQNEKIRKWRGPVV